MSFHERVKRLIAGAAGKGVNATHDGMLKAMGQRFAATRRQPKRREVELDELVAHRFATFAFGVPNRRARRNAPAPGVKRTKAVPIFYQPVMGTGKYTGEKLREIRADGKHR